MVKDRLFNKESKRKENGETFKALMSVKQERHGRNKSIFHQNQQRGQSKSQLRKDVTCHHCGRLEHFKRECRKWKAKQSRNQPVEASQANTTIAGDEVEVVLDDNIINLTYQDQTWVVDSGASFHVTSRKDIFSSYVAREFGFLRIGNNGASKIIGMGDVYLETNIGYELLLKDAQHVSDIRLNLISIEKLNNKGYKSYFGRHKWKLTKGTLVMARGNKMNSLYTTKAKLRKSWKNVIEKEIPIELWHKRLGHMSEKRL